MSKWIDHTGKESDLKELTDSHLRYIIRMLEGHAVRRKMVVMQNLLPPIYKDLMKELKRRGLTKLDIVEIKPPSYRKTSPAVFDEYDEGAI